MANANTVEARLVRTVDHLLKSGTKPEAIANWLQATIRAKSTTKSKAWPRACRKLLTCFPISGPPEILGPMAAKATLHRSANYKQLSPQEQWDEDKRLGILDWDGDPNN